MGHLGLETWSFGSLSRVELPFAVHNICSWAEVLSGRGASSETQPELSELYETLHFNPHVSSCC